MYVAKHLINTALLSHTNTFTLARLYTSVKYATKHSSNRAILTHIIARILVRNRSSVKYVTKHSIIVAILADTNVLTMVRQSPYVCDACHKVFSLDRHSHMVASMYVQ